MQLKRSLPLFLSVLPLLFAAGCGAKTNAAGDGTSKAPSAITILNVSYDPTREFYQEFNGSFAVNWKTKTGQDVTVKQSHGGSGKQARAVIDGLKADVVTLALAYDVDSISQKAKLLESDWQTRLPYNSAPYKSTIVFLVRKGNPKQIKDWDDLVKGEIQVITPNPKTSGGARWNYLAAWGYVLRRELGDLKKLSDPKFASEAQAAQTKAQAFVAELIRHVPVLDSGARDSTNTFVGGTGDVLLAWENEAFLAVNKLGPDKYDIVVPSVSILAEPTVGLVDKVAAKNGTTDVAKAYLNYLYTEAGQRLAAKHYYRPADSAKVPAEDRKQFTNLDLFTIEETFGGWNKAQKDHFADGGTFDQITTKK